MPARFRFAPSRCRLAPYNHECEQENSCKQVFLSSLMIARLNNMAYWSPDRVMRKSASLPVLLPKGEFPRVLAYPIPGSKPASNAVRRYGLSVTPNFNQKNFPTVLLPSTDFGKMFPAGTFICESLHYELIFPLFSAFFAAFSRSENSAPQALHIKMPLSFSPITPHKLHSLLISFPNTSSNATDCSLHF